MYMVQRADGEQRGLQTALGVELSSSSKAILDWAGRKRLRAERYPSREALLAAVDEDAGSVHYKRLSSFTHGNLDAMMALYTEIEQAQRAIAVYLRYTPYRLRQWQQVTCSAGWLH
jgi:hypothetical protein